MYRIYFLYSQKANNVYVGCTKDIGKRLTEHQKGLVKSTKNRRPLLLIRTEEYSNLSLARKREDYLKSLYGSREKKKVLNEYLTKKAPYTQT